MKKIKLLLLGMLILMGALSLTAYGADSFTVAPVSTFYDDNGVIAGTLYEFQAKDVTLTAGQQLVYYNGETEIARVDDAAAIVLVEMQDGENRIRAEVVDSSGETISVSPEKVVLATQYGDLGTLLSLDFNSGATTGVSCNQKIIHANDVVDDEHGNSLCITNSSTSTAQDQVAVSLPSYSYAGNIFEYSADFYFKDFTPSNRHLLGLAGGMDLYNVTVHRTGTQVPGVNNTKGELRVGSASRAAWETGNVKVMDLDINTWYNFKRVINFKDQSVTLYVNNIFKHKKTYTQLASKGPTMMIHRSFQETWTYGDVTIKYYMDNVKFRRVAPNATAQVSYPGAVDSQTVPYENTQIKVEFSAAMDTALLTGENIILTDQDGVAVPAELTYDSTDNSLLILPTGTLGSNRGYQLTLQNLTSADGLPLSGTQTFQFKTDKLPFCIDDITLTGSTAAVQLRNTTGSSKSAVMFVGAFGENIMYDYKVVPVTVTGTAATETVTLTIPVGASIKACLVENTSLLDIFDRFILE